MHWKLDETEERLYSIRPDDYPRLPLFKQDAPNNKKYLLNHVFWLIFDQLPTWQSMGMLGATSTAQLEKVITEDYPAIEESPSGSALPAVSKFSKPFLAYLDAMLATTPFWGSSSDGRARGLPETHRDAFYKLSSSVTDKALKEYVVRKILSWHKAAPAGKAAGAPQPAEAAAVDPAAGAEREVEHPLDSPPDLS